MSFTALGGNQYVNSSAIGDYADYLTREIIPFVDPRSAPLGFRIPFNAESGEAIAERWRNWRRHDPINLVATYRANLKSLRGIYIDYRMDVSLTDTKIPGIRKPGAVVTTIC